MKEPIALVNKENPAETVVPQQMEDGCPILWMSRSLFLATSPFAKFYERAFREMAP